MVDRSTLRCVSCILVDDLAIVVLRVTMKRCRVNIFVGNLTYSATDQALRQLFESYGAVDTVHILTDRDTGRLRGFGFVEMPESAAARAAIAGLHSRELDGRALTVNEARPREPRREPRRSRW